MSGNDEVVQVEGRILAILWTTPHRRSVESIELLDRYKEEFGEVNLSILKEAMRRLIKNDYVESGISYGRRWFALTKKGVDFCREVLGE
ncbi:MAG: hypothetical protein QXG39_00335 [Candidatus Aenigmatarchaeota archaeon]